MIMIFLMGYFDLVKDGFKLLKDRRQLLEASLSLPMT